MAVAGGTGGHSIYGHFFIFLFREIVFYYKATSVLKNENIMHILKIKIS